MGNPLDTVLAEYRVALDDAERLAAEAEHLEHLRKVVIAEESDQTLPEWKADALARAMVQALRDGVEDVYPGDIAQEWLARWRDNPKVLERELAAGGQ